MYSRYFALGRGINADSLKNEAIGAGVPQVVLPLWEDHYNFAQLAEDLGVGLYGTRDTAPDWTIDGLTVPILNILSGNEGSRKIQKEAKRVGELARKEPGRYVSAEVIAKLASLDSI